MTDDRRFEAAIAVLENDALPSYLPQQRWFADKDVASASVRLLDAAALDAAQHDGTGDAATSYEAVFTLPERDRLYFVPLALGTAGARTIAALPDGAAVADAFASDAFVLAVLDDARSGRRREGLRGGTFVASATAALREVPVSASPRIRRTGVEQSNTSVFIDDAIVLKGYRRTHAGPQPELEVARFLDAVGYRNTPALLGFVEYERRGSASAALCILQQFVANEGDAWAWTLAYLGSFLRRAASSEGARRGEEHAAYVAWSRRLGMRTAELHRAFATPSREPGFAPRPVTENDVAAWTERARDTARRALEGLARQRERVPAALAADVDGLLAHRDAIVDAIAPPHLDLDDLVQTRYHGDFHLGQVLVVRDDAMIVDFEGEPGRDVETRRLLSSPLRDVAGMLRSFDYAAVAALNAAEEEGRAVAALEPLVLAWERAAVRAFLDGYRETIAGCPSVPPDPAKFQSLLDLFTLEKAFYEMSYELANRPAWLRIPIAGIAAVLGSALRG